LFHVPCSMIKSMKYDFIAIGGAVEDVSFYTSEGQVIDNPKDILRQKLLGFEYGAKIKAEGLGRFPGGGANNVAVSLARLGFAVGLATAVGDDETGKRLIKNLDDNGVDTRLVKIVRHRDSGFSLIVVSPSGEHVAFTYRGANDELSLNKIESHMLSYSKWLCVSSLSGEWEKVLDKVFSIKNAKVAWNPGGTQLREGVGKLRKWIKKTELLCLNKDEALELAISDAKYKRKGEELSRDMKSLLIAIKDFGPGRVIITSGDKGADYFDGQMHHYEASLGVPKNKIVDTSGVGDAFFSTTLAGLETFDGDIKKSMKMAMKNAAGVLRQAGAQNGLMKLN
jgi:ribokinase